MSNAQILQGVAEDLDAEKRLHKAAPDLLNGCNALLGLISLVAGRDDLSDEQRAALTHSHRITEARAAIAKAAPHKPAQTMGELMAMTPEQRRADAERWFNSLAANGGNINSMDPFEPSKKTDVQFDHEHGDETR